MQMEYTFLRIMDLIDDGKLNLYDLFDKEIEVK